MSNPAPTYVENVANAFKSGNYEFGGILFGTNNYGDMESTIAAIYLDSAARNVALDSDISNGALREPILKVLALMRSMEFSLSSPVTALQRLSVDIGQMAHEFPSVFSFFLSDFQPYGRVGDTLLVSPEATLLDMPKTIGLINGMTSLVKFGLSSCEGGWGYEYCRERVFNKSPLGVLEFNRTLIEEEFSFETFEGPSLVGGLDHVWVGRYFGYQNSKVVIDPLMEGNHVIHFPTTSWNGEFFSPPAKNEDLDGCVVKFRYLSLNSATRGCIGYVDAERSSLNTQTWALCDGSIMESNGDWISCQFVVPTEITSFRIVVGDRSTLGGNAFFDDIQLARGNETSCTGVEITKKDPSGQFGYSSKVVNRLATLLTAGRLSNESKAIVIKAFDNAGSAVDGLRTAQQLILTSAEFHTTDKVKATDKSRDDVVFPNPSGKSYKAVIYLMLSGGCDSFNMLIPHTCDNGLYETYLGETGKMMQYIFVALCMTHFNTQFYLSNPDVRQQVAVAKNQLLPISASEQICDEFGLHPALSSIKSLYDDSDLLFFANTGVLSQPVTKDNYYVLTNTQLFAHNHMQRETKRIDPYEFSSGTGILGRMTDVLSREGSNTGSFSVDRFSVALVGKPGESDAPMIVNRNGVPEVYLDETKDLMKNLHNKSHVESGIFAETWSSSLMQSISTNELLSSELDGLDTQLEFPDTYLGSTLSTVSKLISTRDVRGVDVDTFYIEQGGEYYFPSNIY